jgi:hypothetical protein
VHHLQPALRHEERLRHHVVGPVPDDPSIEDIPPHRGVRRVEQRTEAGRVGRSPIMG